MSSDYWTEHAEIAINDAGLVATKDQIETIAGVFESGHDFYGQSHGHDVASANFAEQQRDETDRLRRENHDLREQLRHAEGDAKSKGYRIDDLRIALTRTQVALEKERGENA